MQELSDSGMSPKALQSRPILYDWMREYVEGFFTLSNTRQYGMAANPIQMSEILAYMHIYGTQDRQTFVEYILLMDSVFLAIKAKKSATK